MASFCSIDPLTVQILSLRVCWEIHAGMIYCIYCSYVFLCIHITYIYIYIYIYICRYKHNNNRADAEPNMQRCTRTIRVRKTEDTTRDSDAAGRRRILFAQLYKAIGATDAADTGLQHDCQSSQENTALPF